MGTLTLLNVPRHSPVMGSGIPEYMPLIFSRETGEKVPYPAADAPLPKMQWKKENPNFRSHQGKAGQGSAGKGTKR